MLKDRLISIVNSIPLTCFPDDFMNAVETMIKTASQCENLSLINSDEYAAVWRSCIDRISLYLNQREANSK